MLQGTMRAWETISMDLPSGQVVVRGIFAYIGELQTVPPFMLVNYRALH